MLYMQLVEWIAMRNLILYQMDKSIGQLTYELENEIVDEPLRKNQSRFTLKQLKFRKLEIILYRKLKIFGIIILVCNSTIKLIDFICAFLS